MKNTMIDNNEYKLWLIDLKNRVKGAQIKTALHINRELICLYWSIGADIVQKKLVDEIGGDFYTRLSRDLCEAFPEVKGFSRRNILYIRSMYLLFSPLSSKMPQVAALNVKSEKLPHSNETKAQQTLAFTQLVETKGKFLNELCKIPWGHIRIIIDRKFSADKSMYYVHKTIENGWSRSMLLNMMDTNLYEANGKAITNFSDTMPQHDSEHAQQLLKDPYNFDFLTLHEDYKEKDLQKALEKHISRLLLELGRGFSYVGSQVKFEVDGDEYFCDLLFYQIFLKRYVVVELKTVKFQPEFISKLHFYCKAVDHQMRIDNDGETIGLLICKEKNDTVVKWTLEDLPIPIGVSKYELNCFFPSKDEIELQINDQFI